MNNIKSVVQKHWLPVLILFCSALFYSFSTHFFMYSTGSYGHDAGIFAYVGYAMQNGRVLYTQVWENKGPLLYFINFLGVLVNYEYGIYFLELIALFVTLLFLYKTANLYFNRWISLLGTLFCMLPLSVTLEGGNLSEEYALPFISVGFYFIAKFFRQDCKLKKLEMSIVGVTLSAVFLLRANILAFQVCLVIAVIAVLIQKRRFDQLLRVFLFALLGFVIFTLPFVIYLVKNNALGACLQTAYFGAVSSFSPFAKADRIRNVVDMIESFINSGSLFIVASFFVAFPVWLRMRTKRTKEKENGLLPLLWACLAGLFVNVLANSLSGANHMHYFMTFIPIILLPASWLFDLVFKYLRSHVNDKMVSLAITYVFAILISIHSFPQLSHMVIDNIRNADKETAQYTLIGNYIKENTTPEETVQIFGGAPAVTSYYRAQRLSASKYCYYANGWFSEEAKDDFANKIFEEVLMAKPRVILVQSVEKYQDFLSHIDDYTTWLTMINNEYIEEENNFGCIVYKRK